MHVYARLSNLLCLSAAHSQSHWTKVLAIPPPSPTEPLEELPGAPESDTGEQQGRQQPRGQLQLITEWEDL